jgi:hypothetical protein
MRGRDLVGSTRSADRPASPVRSRASGGCCCRGSRADTSGRTSILGLFPCWATSASRSCSGLGGRGHSADGGFILRRVAWLSQAKTRPEARPARTYSGAAQTGGCTFHRIAPAWGAAATATWAGGTWAALCWAGGGGACSGRGGREGGSRYDSPTSIEMTCFRQIKSVSLLWLFFLGVFSSGEQFSRFPSHLGENRHAAETN